MPVRLSGSAALMPTSEPPRSARRIGAKLGHRLGQRELLARHSGHEASAADLPSRLEPPVDHQESRHAGALASRASRRLKTTP